MAGRATYASEAKVTGEVKLTMAQQADLQRQNEELKGLLNQYLSSRINEDLHVPPTQVIRLDGLKKGGTK